MGGILFPQMYHLDIWNALKECLPPIELRTLGVIISSYVKSMYYQFFTKYIIRYLLLDY